MRYNQYSYTKTDQKQMLAELASIGILLSETDSDKKTFESFLRQILKDRNPDSLFHVWLADNQQDLLHFFQSDQEMSASIFYMVAFQLLGFIPFVDFEEVEKFHQEINFPITYGNLIENLYQLLNTRTKSGNTLIDLLVSEGMIPEDNTYHFFNGKSLATFSTHDLIREVVYVQSRVDTDGDGQADLIQVSIIRPRYQGKIPSVMTASPYHRGVNDKASDRALINLNINLDRKTPRQITVQTPQLEWVESEESQAPEASQASEKLGHIGTLSINDYFLSRGFASIYVSGVGTQDSQGLMTSGDYQQIEAYKNVIDWLNGRSIAFTDPHKSHQIKASWSNGKVATTGLSYLGTMSNGLASTGVDGLEVIIAEAGISSWYNYYRENGLIISPGGYPGEDFDSLTELTYSRPFKAAEGLRMKEKYQAHLKQQQIDLERQTGDYNQFWHDRNYLLNADKLKAEVVFTHGTQDWNVKPIHVYQMFHALPKHIRKHLFLHNGAHVYMHNWQSIDFRESMNALLSQKLLGHASSFELPKVIWQDNSQAQNWLNLEDFYTDKYSHFSLGEEEKIIQNAYKEEDYTRYSKAYPTFKQELYENKAQQITVDLPLDQDLFINGQIKLHLRLKSSTDKGLISAQLLDYGQEKRLAPNPAILAGRSMDNGRYFAQDNLCELPFAPSPYRVVTTGHLNLQNRHDLLTVESVSANEWMECSISLQPTIYKMKAGSTLRVILYTTDFEHTLRDKEDYHLTIDLGHSSIDVPNMVE